MLKFDNTIANVERGQFIRLCVEVDLTASVVKILPEWEDLENTMRGTADDMVQLWEIGS